MMSVGSTCGMLPANSCLPQQKRAMRGVLFRCLPTWKFAARRSVLCYVASTGAVQARRRRRQTTRNSEPDMDSSTSLETRGLVNSQETSNSAKNVLSGRAPAAEAFSKARGWVVFSDLHCSSKTIDTALEVLQLVRKEATARNAGVLFLGDFWDRRGDLPVIPLNRVQQELQCWHMPLLLLPGNHDQVDLGGLDHSLQPLQVAARCAHVFTQPTLFRDALWVPYRRDESVVRAAISAAQQQGPIKAIFGHADVLTAHMNASYQARNGLPPELFPQQIPVYLGHYHYPHTVVNTSIIYIGSPFQVSANEAGQQKRLLYLNQHWQLEQEIPIQVGREYFAFRLAGYNSHHVVGGIDGSSRAVTTPDATIAETLGTVGSSQQQGLVSSQPMLDPDAATKLVANGVLRRGDVVVLKANEGHEQLTEVQRVFAQQGVQVQLQLQPSKHATARIASAEQLSMTQLLEVYAENTGMRPEVLEVARDALKELGSMSSETPTHSHLELQEVTIEGFGPFKTSVTYPLADRGVVAVTGRNEDDAAAASNGAGKTSLLTSLLWAFKAPDGRAMNAADYVNEESKMARVTVTGAINQEPFELTRTVRSWGSAGATRSGLSLTVKGVDLTGQEQRLTEETLRTKFSTELLPKTLVFTQEDLLSLLQSNDAAFKSLLSCVVDTSGWEQARDRSLAELRQLNRSIESEQVLAQHIQSNIQRAEAELQQQQQLLQEWGRQLQQQQVEAAASEQSTLQQVASISADIRQLQQLVTAALATAAEQQQTLKAANVAAQEATATAAAEQPVADGQQSHSQLGIHISEDALQQQQQQVLPVYAESAAQEQLQPLLQAERQAQQGLAAQQGRSRELKGQVTAVHARRSKYEQLLSATNKACNSNGSTDKSHSSSNEHAHMPVAAVLAAAAAAAAPAAVATAGTAGVSGCKVVAPICEQCLQPIQLDLYQRNLDTMAAEEQQLMQQLERSTQQEKQLAVALADAQQHSQALQQQQEQQRRHVRRERERIMAGMAAVERQKAAETQRLRQLEQRQRQEQRRRQAELWQEEQQLQGEVVRLSQLVQSLLSAQPQLASSLDYIHQRLGASQCNMSTSQGSTSSSSIALAAATWEDLNNAAVFISHQTQQVCRQVIAAADAVLSSRSRLQQLSGLQNPYTSGVQQIQRGLQEKQQQLEQNLAHKQELLKQRALWRQVDAAFGRTGVRSFVLEGVLGELQAACSRHLNQLAAGMSLELSATTADKKTASKKGRVATEADGTDAAPPASKKGMKAGKTAAAAANAGSVAQLGATSSEATAAGGASESDIDLAADADALYRDNESTAAAREVISKIVRVRAAGGEMRERSIAQLSGGEKKRVALALGLGFAEIVAARSRLTSNILVLDEVLEKLDEEGCVRVASLLKTVPYSSVFVVGQAGSFVTKEFASVDTVVKSGGCSFVEIGM